MTTASQARARSNAKAQAKPSRRAARQDREKFLGLLTPNLRNTVEALQKLYRKK